jgi:hypothetical protein
MTTWDRLGRVVSLDADVFGELASDETATGPATLVVVGAALVGALGGAGSAADWLGGVADACLRWLVWVGALHAGTRVLGFQSDLAGLVRALGFAAAPAALLVLSALPWIGGLFWLAAWGLTLATFVLGVRQVLAIETLPAFGLVVAALGAALVVTLPLRGLHAG